MARSNNMVALPAAWLLLLLSGTGGQAQPEPSFRTGCEGLRDSLARLAAKPGEYFTIQLVDTLRYVGSDQALAYLGLCEPPAPRVLCVTYSRDDWKVGDRVMVSGAFSEDRPGYVKLDPCLHARPPE